MRLEDSWAIRSDPQKQVDASPIAAETLCIRRQAGVGTIGPPKPRFERKPRPCPYWAPAPNDGSKSLGNDRISAVAAVVAPGSSGFPVRVWAIGGA
jgi:hypothetical protein